jgi:predicted MPP superfamily phosphohydrolase
MAVRFVPRSGFTNSLVIIGELPRLMAQIILDARMIIWIDVIAAYIVALNFAFAALQVWILRRSRNPPRWLGHALYAWAATMSALGLLQLFGPDPWKAFTREYLYFPMAVEMVWNLLLLQALAPLMILVVLIVRRLRPAARSKPAAPDGISRRRFLYLLGYGAAPATAIGMGVHGALSQDDLRVREFQISIANLPPQWEGLKIAHVSDLHSGLFVGPTRLKIISDATNDLKADLVAVTGDLINREMTEFPAALAAIQRMESRYGTFLCEGNHDTIPGDCVLVAECYRNQLRMLFNKSQALAVPGPRLLLGGLSWARVFQMERGPSLVADLFPQRQEGDVRILLAHHPHLFDISQDVDLVLSGHTHGGQIMLSENVGLGRIRFKYCSGRFHRDRTTMIVSNGCGDWFPCRIGAPAEVALLRLTKAG